MISYTLKNNKQFQLIISALFICSIFISSSFGARVGYDEIFDLRSVSQNRRAQPVTMSEDGTIDNITMYHRGGSGLMILGVYDNYNGRPDDRLGITAETNVNSSTGWQTIELISPVSVSEGQTIWLAWIYQNNPGIYYESGSPGRANSSYDWNDGSSRRMPDPFGSSSTTNYIYSIYATYTTVQTYELTLDLDNIQGMGSVSIDGTPYTSTQRIDYPEGTVVTLVPNPNSGYILTDWGADFAGNTDNPLLITMTRDYYVEPIYLLGTQSPVITIHPQSMTVLEGANVIFEVGADGNPTPTYQWYENGSAMSGETSWTLFLKSVTCEMNGNYYYAIASNGIPPDAQSNSATLTISTCGQVGPVYPYYPGSGDGQPQFNYDTKIDTKLLFTDYPSNEGPAIYNDGPDLKIEVLGNPPFPAATFSFGAWAFECPVELHVEGRIQCGWDLLVETGNISTVSLYATDRVECSTLKINNWTIEAPDHVLDKGYNLRSLGDLENYINKNKHLPEVPSASDMKKDGVDLSELNMTLLKKIEELTIYTIQQQKEIDLLKEHLKK